MSLDEQLVRSETWRSCDVFFRLPSVFTLLVKWHAFYLTAVFPFSPSLPTPEDDQFRYGKAHRLIRRGQQRHATWLMHIRAHTHSPTQITHITELSGARPLYQ